METTKKYQLPDIVLPGNNNLAAERKMITVTLDNKDRLIITRYVDPNKYLAAILTLRQEEKEDKIQSMHAYDSDDYDGNYTAFFTDILEDIHRINLLPNMMYNN